ncbi:hypothetical protein FB451DRAFT_1273210 [Mycena latifolia]|nr:hypothetical protein FB451DRAFT_1273210 [Mycena latifolia]
MDDDTSRYLVSDGIRCDDPSEFEQAVLFSAAMGDSRMSYLWQRALEIGFRAAGGHAEGVKEGRASGLRDGKKEDERQGRPRVEGGGTGKRLGFVAGREFGEKQAAKLSKSLAPSASYQRVERTHPSRLFPSCPPTLPTPPPPRRPTRGARHAHRSACTRLPPCPHATRGSMPSPAIAFAAKPSTAGLGSPLDWDHDPRLLDLSRALRTLGRQGRRF